MNYKTATKDAYDTHAQKFEESTKMLQEHILAESELFISSLESVRVLDLGSGPGRDAIFLKKRGLNPLCFDISPQMIKLCQKKGLETMVGDLEEIPFKDEEFDGVWAYTSLLHIPKIKLPSVLKRINKILKPNGVFYCGMKEGDFEGFVESEKYPGSKRFFALYRDEELRKIISPNFDIVHTSKVELGEATFLNYLCKKPSK